MSRKRKINIAILVGLLILLLPMWFFNINPVLPTNFSKVVEKNMRSGDHNDIEKITVSTPYTLEMNLQKVKAPPKDFKEFDISNQDTIRHLLDNKLRIWNGGNMPTLRDCYDLTIHFKDGSFQRYVIAEKWILAADLGGNLRGKRYKVLDNTNALYNELVSFINNHSK